MTRAGIENEDFTDGSYTYMYWLGNTFIREAINKFFGIEMSKFSIGVRRNRQLHYIFNWVKRLKRVKLLTGFLRR